jgi:hypothetical protein
LSVAAAAAPKRSPAAASLASSLIISLHVVPLRWKTYAEPDEVPLSSLSVAPMIAVSPLIATEAPKRSPPKKSLARRLACCVHVVPLRMKT